MDPFNTLPMLFLAFLTGLVGAVVGVWGSQRALWRAVWDLTDGVEAVNKRLARREGADGQAIKRNQRQAVDHDTEAALAVLRASTVQRPPPPPQRPPPPRIVSMDDGTGSFELTPELRELLPKRSSGGEK
jgi:hypothetical protein